MTAINITGAVIEAIAKGVLENMKTLIVAFSQQGRCWHNGRE